MNLIERVKNILITPKTEWNVVQTETATPMGLLTGYVLPLAIVSSLGSVIRYFLFAGAWAAYGMKFMIITALIGFVSTLIAYYLTVIVVDAFAATFGSEKNMGSSAQIVAYSATPSYIAGLLSFIPIIGWLISIGGWVYGIYLMYLGLGPVKKTPEDKKVVYMIVVYVIMIAIFFVIGAILTAIFLSSIITGAAALSAY